MPQINIPKSIDTQFLAHIGNLEKRWGSAENTDGLTQTFEFFTGDTDAVELALAEYPTKYLDHRKTQKLVHLSLIRRDKELNGPQGLRLDDKTVQRLTAAAVGLLIDTGRLTVRWELTRGVFMTFTRDQVLGLAALSVGHVQDCFDVVFAKTEMIKAITIDDQDPTPLQTALAALDAIDLNTGWPQPA